MLKELNLKFLLKILIIAVLFIILFYPVYLPLFERFNAKDSYYSHGFLIPFISLYLVWRKRKRLKEIEIKPSFTGIFVIGAGVLLHLVSTFLMINFTSYVAMPIVILGILLYLGGTRLTKELLFPVAFLIFMLPLPRVLIIGIAFKMKILVAQTSSFIASRLGIDTRSIGSTIYYPGGYLIVGDPCSGLRSLISFLALGALFTQFAKADRLRKNALFISTVPIAFLSNLARIMLLLLVSYIYGKQAALGFFHDASGVMVFVLGFLGLILVSKVLRCPLTIEDI